MSFFNIIKKSFGFGDEVDEELLDDNVETGHDALPAPAARSAGGEKVAEVVGDLSLDKAKSDLIFDHVVKIFNEALPAFIRDSVDPEQQRKILYDGLDASLKDYIVSIGELTRRQCEARWASEQAAMRNEMDGLRNKAKEIEQQRFDIKQQQLSADRQKRALTDRVHDLETQIANLEAEREQFDLENKSLVNKLKVAGVHETEAEDLRTELNDARAEIARLRAGGVDAISEEEKAKANERIAELEKELATLQLSLDEAAEKDRIATEMFNGLQSKASSSREELEAKIKEIEVLKAKLAEAEAVRHEVDELSEQMSRIEEVIEKRDRKIAKLKETCESLRAENSSLQQTIARNLKLHAESEAALNERIAELESDPTTPIAATVLEEEPEEIIVREQLETATPKISDGDLAAIEESFDSADWMRTDPPETPSMRTGVSEAEFGYQAPQRKTPRHDNDAQLSLF